MAVQYETRWKTAESSSAVDLTNKKFRSEFKRTHFRAAEKGLNMIKNVLQVKRNFYMFKLNVK